MTITIEMLMPPGATHLHRALLASMAARPSATQIDHVLGLVEADHDPFLDLAERNRVGPIAAHCLIEHHPEGPARPRAEVIHEESMQRMGVLLAELDLAASHLAMEGIQVVALKNGGIARGIHPCPGCCPMGDLDVLVDRDRFREAHKLLLELGYSLETRGTVESADLEEGLTSGGTEYVKHVGAHEVWFELQWRPIAGRWIRPDQEPAASDLLDRSLAAPGSEAVRLLAPVDNMLQVCLHTAKHSFVRAPGLRLHTDVDRLATFTPPDWDLLAGTAEKLNSTTATFLSLALSQTLLGAPVPLDTLRRLSPARWKVDLLARWIGRAGVFEPDERKFSRPGMMAFHALLYDDTRGLLASALDTDRGQLGIRHVLSNAASGLRRVKDLAVRYQR